MMVEHGELLMCTEELPTVANYIPKNAAAMVLVKVLDREEQHVCLYQECLRLVASTQVDLLIKSPELKEKSVFKVDSGKPVPSCAVSGAAVCSLL